MNLRVPFVVAAALLVPVSAAAQPAPEPAAPEPTPPPAPTAPAQPPQPSPAAAETEPTAPPAPAPAPEAPGGPKIVPLGYVETHFSWNFNRPANGITNYRGFDNRHATFTLDNVALGANAEAGPVTARLILQVGATPSTYYSGEPSLAGSSGANATSGELWKYIQEANVSWRAMKRLTLQAGLFPSPIGFEVFAVKDNWNWSRSNLFFGFPYYHTGMRGTYELTPELSWTLAVFNGWNSVVDNNEEKSIQTNLTYKVPEKILVQALYFGGIERPTGSPEGPYVRHHFDAFAQWDATTSLSFAAQADYGWEPSRIATARWIAGALYARVKPVDRFYVALRADRFHEHLATNNATGQVSSPIFWNGVEWVSSQTATLDYRPHDQISLRLEYRHDIADTPLYFGRDVTGTGSSTDPYVPDRRTQDTLLLGGTAWF